MNIPLDVFALIILLAFILTNRFLNNCWFPLNYLAIRKLKKGIQQLLPEDWYLIKVSWFTAKQIKPHVWETYVEVRKESKPHIWTNDGDLIFDENRNKIFTRLFNTIKAKDTDFEFSNWDKVEEYSISSNRQKTKEVEK